MLESRADATGELCRRRSEDYMLHSIQHALKNCPSAAREHASCWKNARRLCVSICMRGNRVSAVRARGRRQDFGRNLRRRHCAREIFVDTARAWSVSKVRTQSSHSRL